MQRSIMADRQESLRWLAEQTGGFAIVNQNDINAGIGRIVDDTRGYYLIGFDTALAPGVRPDPADVKITTLRPGLQIRARRGRFGPANPDDGPLAAARRSARRGCLVAVLDRRARRPPDGPLRPRRGGRARPRGRRRRSRRPDPGGHRRPPRGRPDAADAGVRRRRRHRHAVPRAHPGSASTPRPTIGPARTACVTASACR